MQLLNKKNIEHSLSFSQKLFQPVDNSPLVIFRILFGFLLCYHIVTFIGDGKVYELFIQPSFTFTFIGFEFLQPLPGNGMYAWFGIMALLALCIMLGAWYRLAMVGFTVMWSCIYLMQKVDYNNHYYLVVLVCGFMCFVPAHRFCSVDVKRKAVTKSTTCPQWAVWLFIAQMAVVYIFAATSKLTPDWLSGRFIAYRFSGLARHHFVGFIYGSKFFQWLLIYGGIAFDLFIVPLFLLKKTRPYAFVASCLFHLFNSLTFHIGIFPYLSIALNVFFFTPEKIRSIFFRQKAFMVERNTPELKSWAKKLFMLALGLYFFIQIILPLRSLLFPGNVFWNEEGYKMSWKMMLRVKTGKIKFEVVDTASSRTWLIDPSKKLSPLYANWIAISPDMTWQYAQKLRNEFAAKGHAGVKVYAVDSVRLNGREPKLLINHVVNLAAVKWEPFRHSSWIMESPKP